MTFAKPSACTARTWGVPIVRLQKLLGHSSPHMTLRYMKHAPESYFAGDMEAEAQAAPARAGLKPA
jgi:hypothetical protein